MIVRGVGGDVNVRIEHFLYVTEEVAVADILHCRGWISSRTIIAGTQQLDGTWKHLKKMATSIHAPQKKQQVYQKRYSYAYSWTWRHNAALLQTVASALPQALWHR